MSVKIKLMTYATAVIIRAITLFSFIHSGFAGGCQLLQQQLARPGGGGGGVQIPHSAYRLQGGFLDGPSMISYAALSLHQVVCAASAAHQEASSNKFNDGKVIQQ